MVARRALIIECSEISGQDKLPGAKRDADSWEEFLLSNRGGAWVAGEISTLRNPTKTEIINKISVMADGYGFIVFSGHGFVDTKTQDTMACVSGGSISERELTPSCPRSTVILDSCRGIEIAAFSESLRSMFKSAGGDARYRHLFDAALEGAEIGVCRMYGCAFEQAAQESRAGGDFTQALIQSGRGWTGSGVFSLRSAFDAAERAVKSRNSNQTPEFLPGRRLRHFPFSVNP